MEFLFNLSGNHVANLVNDQLYSPTGSNIGHYIGLHGFFVDMNGRYLGEIIKGNRFVYNQYNQYINMNFGVFGDYGDVGDYGNPGITGNLGIIPGYRDVVITWQR